MQEQQRAAISPSQPMGRPVTGASISVCESSRSACDWGWQHAASCFCTGRPIVHVCVVKITLARVHGLHWWTAACTCAVVSRSRTWFPKEAFAALSSVLTRIHVAGDKK